VLAKDAARNTVAVGTRADLAATRVRLRDAVLHRHAGSIDGVRLRYRSTPVPAAVPETGPGSHAELEVELGEAFDAASPGQTAVLLSGEAIVGHGTIVSGAGPTPK
jgi:tRNA U34 2-thiouridine synthase MnmA/TrmU